MKTSCPSHTFGEQLRATRKALNLTQAQAAQESGLSQVVISHYECGVKSPSLTNLRKICSGLGVNANFLLDLEDDLIL